MTNMDQESSYFIPLPPSAGDAAPEVARIAILNKYVNETIGLLPPQIRPQGNVLDLGCGPGAWAHATVDTFPAITVTGIDINESMIAWAKAQAYGKQQLEFHIGDVTKPLTYNDETFDVVHSRFLIGVMSRTTWLPLIRECFRVTGPGGMICLIETDGNFVSNPSEHAQRFAQLVYQAYWRAGKTFSETQLGLATMLEQWLEQAGYHVIDVQKVALDYSFGTAYYRPLVQNFAAFIQLVKPFLLQYVPEASKDIKELSEAVTQEMFQPHFKSQLDLTSIVGQK